MNVLVVVCLFAGFFSYAQATFKKVKFSSKPVCCYDDTGHRIEVGQLYHDGCNTCICGIYGKPTKCTHELCGSKIIHALKPRLTWKESKHMHIITPKKPKKPIVVEKALHHVHVVKKPIIVEKPAHHVKIVQKPVIVEKPVHHVQVVQKPVVVEKPVHHLHVVKSVEKVRPVISVKPVYQIQPVKVVKEVYVVDQVEPLPVNNVYTVEDLKPVYPSHQVNHVYPIEHMEPVYPSYKAKHIGTIQKEDD